MSTRTEDILYIDTPDQLTSLCQQLEASTLLALDTEFLREDTFYPKLCLIQVCNGDLTACIDPLALPDLAPFLDLVYRDDILKIFHAGGQDLEIFYHLTGQLPGPLFDTQIAAPLLGYPLQSGYAALVQSILGVCLDKSHSRTDWSTRPLSPRQLAYAADDVRYLVPLYHAVHGQLADQGRANWLDEDFQALLTPTRYSLDKNDCWQKIRGATRLKNGALAVLQQLAAWRHEEAIRLDRPRNRIIRDDALLDLARLRPDTPEKLLQLRSLRENTRRRYSDTLLKLIRDADTQAPPERKPAPATLTAGQEALCDCLMAVTRLCARDNDINPALLASRKDLEKLLNGDRRIPLLHGWRQHIAGEAVLNYLEGRLQIHTEAGAEPTLQPCD